MGSSKHVLGSIFLHFGKQIPDEKLTNNKQTPLQSYKDRWGIEIICSSPDLLYNGLASLLVQNVYLCIKICNITS